MQLLGRTKRLMIAGSTWLATGCVGSIGDGAEELGEPGAAALCEDMSAADLVGPSPLVRLSRSELDNSLRDLLGDVSHPADVLPEDDRVGPFTSNSITPLGEQTVFQLERIADDVASNAVEDVDALVDCGSTSGEACARSFIERFGMRAFRRPLDASEVDGLVAVFRVGDEEGGFANGVRLVLSAILQSPSFLYRVELGTPTETDRVTELDGFELATRLSFFLWKTTPDDALLAAAGAGDLDSPEGLRAEAERLLADPRADDAIVAFHLEWLGVDPEIAALSKNPDLYPDVTESTPSAMRSQLAAFVTHVFRDDDARLRTFLAAPYTLTNAELAWIDGSDSSSETFELLEVDDARASGLLTLPAVLATHAGYSQTSPTRRGQLVRSRLLCDTVPPPPPDVAAEIEAPAGATRREELEAHASNPACSGCHMQMDPIGFGFESFDAVGAFRTEQDGVAIDASGEVFNAPDDIAGPFSTAKELMERLSESDTVASCVSRQWARFALSRDVSDDEASCGMRAVDEAFAASGYDVRELLLTIVTSEAFRLRREVEN